MIFATTCAFLSISLLGTTASEPTDSQQKIHWIQENAIPIKTIAFNDDYSDLMPLVDIIGDARIVQLGEATHGDGTTFAAKARLVRFLHEVMGFNVLAFESPMYGARLMDAGMRDPSINAYEATNGNIFNIWAKSEQVQDLLDYIKASQSSLNPIRSAGVDCKIGYKEMQEKIVPEYIMGFFDKIDPNLISKDDRAMIHKICTTVDYSNYYYRPDQDKGIDMTKFKALAKYIDTNSQEVLRFYSAEEAAFLKQLMDSIISYEEYCVEVAKQQLQDEPEAGSASTRDMIMGRNFVWLATEVYPKEKIIMWAHNFHIMENIYLYTKPEEYDKYDRDNPLGGPMGHVISSQLGSEVYTIGFLGNSGSWGTAHSKEDPTAIPPAKENTVDWYLNQVDSPYCFLDFQSLPKDHWLRGPMPGRFYFWNETVSLWPRVFDAVFFSKEIEPSTLAKRAQAEGS